MSDTIFAFFLGRIKQCVRLMHHQAQIIGELTVSMNISSGEMNAFHRSFNFLQRNVSVLQNLVDLFQLLFPGFQFFLQVSDKDDINHNTGQDYGQFLKIDGCIRLRFSTLL